jgi:hypothetical protein
MTNVQLINFHQTRDFSKKMSATFEFLRQNFKGLSKSILLIAGPPVLLASLLMGSFIQDMMTTAFNVRNGNPDTMLANFASPTFWLQIALMIVFLLASSVASIATINNYLILYEEKQTNLISVAEVWDRVRNTFMMYLGTCFLFVVLMIAVIIGLTIPATLLAAIAPAVSFFVIMGVMILIFYLVVSTSLLFIIRSYEKIGFMEALFRSHKLVIGKWWSTFGIIFVLYLIAGTMSYVFMIPWYIALVVSSLHSTGVQDFGSAGSAIGVVSTVLLTLYYLAQMLLYSLPAVGIAFQYFNLVERKEARGLMSQITTIGEQGAAALPNDEEY